MAANEKRDAWMRNVKTNEGLRRALLAWRGDDDAMDALLTELVDDLIARREGAPVMRPIDTSGMTGDGGKVHWPRSGWDEFRRPTS